MTNLINLKTENKRLKQELTHLQDYAKNLEQILEKIKSAKAFKLWQGIKNFNFNFIKKIIPYEIKEKIKKLYFRENKKYFEKYLKKINEISYENRLGVKKLNKHQSVSIIIPTKNAGKNFYYTLTKILNQKNIKIEEIIVVDSGSRDETLKIAKELNTKIIKISPDKFSHSKTRNLGAKNAKGKFLLFTVQDAVLATNYTLNNLVYFLEKTNSIAGSCRQIPYFDTDIFSTWQILSHYSFILPKKDNILVNGPVKNFNNLPLEEKRKLCLLDSICLLVKRDDFLRMGGFNEKINYAEDLEIAKRIIEKGGKIFFLYHNAVIHSHNRDASYFLKRFIIDTFYLKKILNEKNSPNEHESFENLINTLFSECLLFLQKKIRKTTIKENLKSLNELKKIAAYFGFKIEYINKKISIMDLDYFVKEILERIKEISPNIKEDLNIEIIDKIISIYFGNKIGNYIFNNQNEITRQIIFNFKKFV